MRSTLLELGPLTIHSYGLMIAIAFLSALHLIQRETTRAGISPDVINTAAFWSLILGIAGARMLHIFMFPGEYSWSDPLGWVAIWRGGLVFQGGPPPVLLFLWLYLKKKGVNFWTVADVAVTYLPLAHGLGRLGCFFHGCCYGKPASVFWALSFPRVPAGSEPPAGSPPFEDHWMHDLVPRDAQWSLPVHPTQLYEFALLVALCLTIKLLRDKWHPFPGFALPLYFVLYGVLRFIVEFFRGDHNPTRFAGSISDQQVFSLIFALLGLLLFFVLRHRANRRPAAQPSK